MCDYCMYWVQYRHITAEHSPQYESLITLYIKQSSDDKNTRFTPSSAILSEHASLHIEQLYDSSSACCII
jgi:hypothetical protein